MFDKADIFDFALYGGIAFIIQGAWSEEEEGQLRHAMEELAKEGRTDKTARGYWVSVSKALAKALDATRTPKQCQYKWCGVLCSGRFIMPRSEFRVCRHVSLRGKIRNEGETRCWKYEDSYILICKCVTCVPDHLSGMTRTLNA